MIDIIKLNSETEKEIKDIFRNREISNYEYIENEVKAILKDIKENGDSALKKYTQEFDKIELNSIEVSRDEINDAMSEADPEFVGAILNALENVSEFHNRQKKQSIIDVKNNGIIIGQKVKGIKRVGIYVPNGKGNYITSILMGAVPAKIAGVEEIVVITPPEKDGKANQEMLVVAGICGIDRVFLSSGAVAIGALAYGTESVVKVDKIIGCGNIYTQIAKKILYGNVDIDMISGASETIILADEKANSKVIAGDLISQAKEDDNCLAILMTTSEENANKVKEQIKIQSKGIQTNIKIIIVDSVEYCINLINELAPAYVQVMLEDPMEYLGKIDNAGVILLGTYTPKVLVDTYCGANYIAPTNSTSRFYSTLSVSDFEKKTNYIYYTKEMLENSKEDIEIIVQKEKLSERINTINLRLE